MYIRYGHHPFIEQMMRRFSFLLVCALCVHALFGAVNPLKEARKNIKSARYEEDGNEANKVRDRLNNTEKSLLEALAGEKSPKKRAEFYRMAAMVQRKFNDIENEKIYLKRAYDTVLYYNSIYKLYRYMEQCDSTEAASLPKSKKYRALARKELLAHRVNLLNGGRFYLKKKNYAEAVRFLDLYLSSADFPMLARDFLSQKDTLYPRVAYWTATAAYYSGDYRKVIRYAPASFRHRKDEEYMQEYLCRSYLALNDSARWIASLRTGMLNFPEHTYFFTNLITALNGRGRHDEALEYIDRMIRYDSKSELFWLAKAVTFMQKGDLKNCISSSEVILAASPMNAEANFYKGLSYCKLALQFLDRMEKETLGSPTYKACKQDMTDCYEKARGPMENVRKLQPQDSVRWAPLLYQIYLHLNQGDGFAEMESIMRKLPLK